MGQIIKRIMSVSIILLLLAGGYGCGARQADYEQAYKDSMPVTAPESPGYGGEMSGRGQGDPQEREWSPGEYIIYQASVNLAVKDLEEAITQVEEVARDHNGFISHSSINRRERDRRAEITLRIPAPGYRDILREIENLGEVTYQSSTAEDVTRQYVDLEARINNLASQEKRLAEILEMADTVEEVLQVEKELERVRGEVEALTADFKYLQDRVSMSTLHLYLVETVLASPGVTFPGVTEIMSRGYRSLVNSINSLFIFAGELIVFIMGALPVLIAAGLFILMLVYLVRAINRRRKDEPPLPPPPPPPGS